MSEQLSRHKGEVHVAQREDEATDYGMMGTDQSQDIQKSFDTIKPREEAIKKVKCTLSNKYYSVEINDAMQTTEFNILVMGSPRVGKSELISALCGGEHLIPTSPGLDHSTTEVNKYILKPKKQKNGFTSPCTINFFDTPGIDSWEDDRAKLRMLCFIDEIKPICLIYCVAPGSFAKLSEVRSVLEHCKNNKIFCAFVVTNMWANNTRQVVISEAKKISSLFGDSVSRFSQLPESNKSHEVTFFGDGALCTMVNSIEFEDKELGVKKPVQGVDELIQGVMESLDADLLLGWCTAVLNRRSFWEKVRQKTHGFFVSRLNTLIEDANLRNVSVATIGIGAILSFALSKF